MEIRENMLDKLETTKDWSEHQCEEFVWICRFPCRGIARDYVRIKEVDLDKKITYLGEETRVEFLKTFSGSFYDVYLIKETEEKLLIQRS